MGLTLREGERGADVVLAIRGEWGGEKKAIMRGGVRRVMRAQERYIEMWKIKREREAVIPHSPSACDHHERPYGG